jgi:hypothetical protein
MRSDLISSMRSAVIDIQRIQELTVILRKTKRK